MNNLLYIYEEVLDLIKARNLDNYEREGAEDKFLWQFSKTGSSLHVCTINQSRFVLYATEKDFNFIKKKADDANLGIVLKESKKEENFINVNVSDFIEFKFKAPKQYNWYIPLIYNSGLNVMNTNHTFKYFVNKKAPATRESSRGSFIYLI